MREFSDSEMIHEIQIYNFANAKYAYSIDSELHESW